MMMVFCKFFMMWELKWKLGYKGYFFRVIVYDGWDFIFVMCYVIVFVFDVICVKWFWMYIICCFFLSVVKFWRILFVRLMICFLFWCIGFDVIIVIFCFFYYLGRGWFFGNFNSVGYIYLWFCFFRVCCFFDLFFFIN